MLAAAIFDVDGVLLASPHERAWREALVGLAEPDRFTTAIYQAHVAGKLRLDGARSALEALGVSNADRHAVAYAERKQARLEELIRTGAVAAFPDALRFVEAVAALGWPMAAASSSRNATAMMRAIPLRAGRSLLDIFRVNVSGRDLTHGKPDPELFLIAAREMGVAPAQCFVAEDAPAGIEAARAGGMAAIGVARLGDAEMLRAARADLVVTSLDDVVITELALGRLVGPDTVKDPKTMKQALEPTADASWVLSDDGCDPLRESDRATRFAISNGFLGVRASQTVNRSPQGVGSPNTYVAGLFDTPDGDRAVPELIPVPNGLQVHISLPGGPLVQHFGPGPSHALTLDMRRGLLLSECRLVDGSAVSARLVRLNLVSQDRRSLGLQMHHLEVERGESEMTLEASFEGLDRDLMAERLDNELGVWRTRRSGKRLEIAAAVALRIDGLEMAPVVLAPFKWSWTWKSRPGQIICLERIMGVARSAVPGPDAGVKALNELKAGRDLGWRDLLTRHETAWAHRWSSSDIDLKGDAAAQKALRFAIYHLNSAANPDDPRVSIGARALTGADYRGHVFWDTEIFLLPFYIVTWPEAARSLLMYRFHTLNGARAKAADRGWRGAFYAWESTDTGLETTPEQAVGPDRQIVDILTGVQEQHISADVAYAVWQYWQATGDDEFLIEAGAEILLETARFWASRAQPEADGLHHIRNVIGPDEYHENIDDNAFTNVMARWNIRRALDVAGLLRQRWPDRWSALSSHLDLNEAELKRWSDVAETLATGLDPATGLYEQFAGYFDLEDVDLSAYAGRTVPMDVILGRERTQQSQVVKQADVVALLALLPGEFNAGADLKNFRYYEPRCGHGSSLSTAMHGLVAARLGDVERALDYFHRTAAIDLIDTKSAIGGGVHIAAQGGLWMMSVFGFAGLALRSDGLALAPQLPASWTSLSFSLQWRNRSLAIRIDQTNRTLEVSLESGLPMIIAVYGEPHSVSLDQALVADIRQPVEPGDG